MEQIAARSLLTSDKKAFLLRPDNPLVKVTFDDGVVECYYRCAVLSSYAWELISVYPELTLSKDYLINLEKINKGSLDKVWGKILNRNSDWLYEKGVQPRELGIHYMMSINKLHNDNCRYLIPYIPCEDTTALLGVMYHPKMVELMQDIKPNHYSIDETYKKAKQLLIDEPDLKNNPFARGCRWGIIKVDQALQIFTVRGYATEIDQKNYPKPIMSGYGEGIHDPVEAVMESRAAPIAESAKTKPVSDADYLNRKLQIAAGIFRTIYKGDCGSNEYIEWYVEETNVPSLIGVNFVDEDGVLRFFTEEDASYVGKRILIRNPLLCHNLHQFGVCEACLGKISRAIPRELSVGHISTAGSMEGPVQTGMSMKHLILSLMADEFVIGRGTGKWLKHLSVKEKNQLCFKSKTIIQGYADVSLSIPDKSLKFIADLNNGVEVKDIQITSASYLDVVTVIATTKDGNFIREILKVSDITRKSHLSKEFITYIFEHPELVTMVKSNMHVSLSGWDVKLPIFVIPDQIKSVKDYIDKFGRTLDKGRKFNGDGLTPTGIADMLRSCYNLINSAASTPISQLGVVLAALLIRDRTHLDYRPPMPGGPRAFDTLKSTHCFRSVSQMLSFENRQHILQLPATIIIKTRADHPFDAIYEPSAFDPYSDVRWAVENGLIDPKLFNFSLT